MSTRHVVTGGAPGHVYLPLGATQSFVRMDGPELVPRRSRVSLRVRLQSRWVIRVLVVPSGVVSLTR